MSVLSKTVSNAPGCSPDGRGGGRIGQGTGFGTKNDVTPWSPSSGAISNIATTSSAYAATQHRSDD